MKQKDFHQIVSPPDGFEASVGALIPSMVVWHNVYRSEYTVNFGYETFRDRAILSLIFDITL